MLCIQYMFAIPFPSSVLVFFRCGNSSLETKRGLFNYRNSVQRLIKKFDSASVHLGNPLESWLCLDVMHAVNQIHCSVRSSMKQKYPRNGETSRQYFKLTINHSLVKLIKRMDFNYYTGPRGLPIVGYIPFLTKLDPEYPHLALKKLADQYGPVTGFYLGPTQPFISVCGYEAVKEALNNDDLIGRPSNVVRRERTFGQKLG